MRTCWVLLFGTGVTRDHSRLHIGVDGDNEHYAALSAETVTTRPDLFNDGNVNRKPSAGIVTRDGRLQNHSLDELRTPHDTPCRAPVDCAAHYAKPDICP